MPDPCPHDLAERETACADGYCPLCMVAEIHRLELAAYAVEMPQYNKDEERVSEYIQRLTKNQVGSGDDPIGFLIASHAAILEREDQRANTKCFECGGDLSIVCLPCNGLTHTTDKA